MRENPTLSRKPPLGASVAEMGGDCCSGSLQSVCKKAILRMHLVKGHRLGVENVTVFPECHKYKNFLYIFSVM